MNRKRKFNCWRCLTLICCTNQHNFIPITAFSCRPCNRYQCFTTIVQSACRIVRHQCWQFAWRGVGSILNNNSLLCRQLETCTLQTGLIARYVAGRRTRSARDDWWRDAVTGCSEVAGRQGCRLTVFLILYRECHQIVFNTAIDRQTV